MRRIPSCANDCGRFVWNHQTGLCGQCDPATRHAAERSSARIRARHARRKLLGGARR